MAAFESVLEVFGATPLVRVRNLASGLRPRVYLKLEFHNPGGSVKDRAALSMIRAAERDGMLAPGGTIVETTSGNTGVGLALVGAHLGYRVVIFTSSQIAREKIALLRAYGAEVRHVDAFVPKGHPDSLGAVAQRYVDDTLGAWRANQYDNPANPAAHRASTGPEIWADTDGAVTHFVATAGTGGTVTGTGEALKELSGGRVRVVVADPEASSYSGGDGGPKVIEGAGHAVHPAATEDVWPQSFHLDVVDEYVAVSDRDSILTARRAARQEGLLLGGSAGTALAAALRLAESLGDDDVVVALAPDSGRNALSTYYDDEWLADRGFVLDEPGSAEADEADAAQRADPVDAAGPVEVARLTDPIARVAADLSPSAALELLDHAGVGDDDPVLAVYRRSAGDGPVPPSDVVGTTSRAALRTAVAEGAGASVAEVAAAPLPTVGAGRTAADAVARLDAAREGWQAASVLGDARIVGVASRERLLGSAAATAPDGPAADLVAAR